MNSKKLTARQQRVLDDQSSNSFGKTYYQLCQLYALPIITDLVNYDPKILFLDVDKVHKDEEWSPILVALKKNRDLVRVSVFIDLVKASKRPHSQVAQVGNRFSSGPPVKPVHRILPDLMTSLKDVLFNAQLRILDISGVPLRETALKIISKGLINNQNLQYLSFAGSLIGDSGVFILAPSIRTIKQLKVLNFSGCKITEKGAHIISAFLKSLAVRRQADCWAYSLRLSPLDIADPSRPSQTARKSPKPLKRLIMCQNELGDNGVVPLLDLLLEDVGLLAIDLQLNNLTSKTGKRAIEIMKTNRDLVRMDLKQNHIGPESLNRLNHYIEINQKVRANVHPAEDYDLKELESKDLLKPIIFEPPATEAKSFYMHTQSSVAKSNISRIPSAQHFTNDQKKKLMLHARPKSEPNNIPKRLQQSQKDMHASKLQLLKRFKKINKENIKSFPKVNPKVTHNEMKEIDITLKALDLYYTDSKIKSPKSNHQIDLVPIFHPPKDPSNTKASEENSIQAPFNPQDGEQERLVRENIKLKERLTELEQLVKSIIRSIPKKPSPIPPSPPETKKEMPLVTFQESHNTGNIKSNIIQLQGILKKPRSNIDELVELLENTVQGFSKIVDNLDKAK